MIKYDVNIFATNSNTEKDLVSKVIFEINLDEISMIMFGIVLIIIIVILIIAIVFFVSYLKQKTIMECFYKSEVLDKNDKFRREYIEKFIDEFKAYKKYYTK